MNKSKRIGTEGENWVRDRLRRFWPTVDRGANKPGHDIVGAPLPVEVKRQANLRIPEWTRYLQDLHGDRWLLFVLPRDARLKGSHPPLMVLPAEYGFDMLESINTDEPTLLDGIVK